MNLIRLPTMALTILRTSRVKMIVAVIVVRVGVQGVDFVAIAIV